MSFVLEKPFHTSDEVLQNLANYEAHYEWTGPEIWRQTGGEVTAFVSGAGESLVVLSNHLHPSLTRVFSGTGGTLSGVSRFLKQMDSKVKVILADPTGSGLFNKVKYGVMFANEESEGKRRRHQVDTVVEGLCLPLDKSVSSC